MKEVFTYAGYVVIILFCLLLFIGVANTLYDEIKKIFTKK